MSVSKRVVAMSAATATVISALVTVPVINPAFAAHVTAKAQEEPAVEGTQPSEQAETTETETDAAEAAPAEDSPVTQAVTAEGVPIFEGDTVTYTATFENTSDSSAQVGSVLHLKDLLDDADLNPESITVEGSGLNVLPPFAEDIQDEQADAVLENDELRDRVAEGAAQKPEGGESAAAEQSDGAPAQEASREDVREEFAAGAGTEMWIYGELQPKETVKLTFEVTLRHYTTRGNNYLTVFLTSGVAETPEKCEAENSQCARVRVEPFAREVSATVTSDKEGPVRAGDTVTFTFRFENEGKTRRILNEAIDLFDIHDDADYELKIDEGLRYVSSFGDKPTEEQIKQLKDTLVYRANDTVTSERIDSVLARTGYRELWFYDVFEPGEVKTVTVTATARADGARGNNIILARLNGWADLLRSTERDPGYRQLCYSHDSGCSMVEVWSEGVSQWLTVDRREGGPLKPGDRITYTVHVKNDGPNVAFFNAFNDFNGVVDDARLVTSYRIEEQRGPVSKPAAEANQGGGTQPAQPASMRSRRSISEVPPLRDVPRHLRTKLELDPKFESVRVFGRIAAGSLLTVTYSVAVNPEGEQGDGRLQTFLTGPGEETPATCDTSSQQGDRAQCFNHDLRAEDPGIPLMDRPDRRRPVAPQPEQPEAPEAPAAPEQPRSDEAAQPEQPTQPAQPEQPGAATPDAADPGVAGQPGAPQPGATQPGLQAPTAEQGAKKAVKLEQPKGKGLAATGAEPVPLAVTATALLALAGAFLAVRPRRRNR